MAMIPRPQPGDHPWPPDPHRPRQRNRTPAAARGTTAGLHLHDVGPSSLGPTLLDEFRDAWERGRLVRVEDYLHRLHPAADSSALIELVYQEFCLAEEYGLTPDPRDYLDRFPAQHDRLARLFGLHDAIGPAPLDLFHAPADLPEPGDAIGPYQLLRELGRGSFARVFLAEQADLEDRLVVLKVSARPSPEPQLLARAGHPHIVAVLRHGEADDGALHLTCMPFQGGATLGTVLEALRRNGRCPRSGRDLLDALDRAGAPESPPASRESSERALLAGMSYNAAIAWTVARLAQALDHAHHRGVSHGDLKPSNILIAADGRPLLLDFNLASDWQRDPTASLGSDPGGTLAYMAPERLRALAEAGRVPFPNARARHRADLYALGLILAEALGAPVLPVPLSAGDSLRDAASALASRRDGAGRFLREIVRKLPVALRPIVARCLAPDPADRYPRANELAEDLDRFHHNQAPRYAPRVSWTNHLHARAIRARRTARYTAIGAAVLVPMLFMTQYSWTSRQHAQAVAFYDAFVDQAGAEPLRTHLFYSNTHIPRWEPTATYIRRLEHFGVPGSSSWLDQDHLAWLPETERVDLQLTMAEQAWCLARRVEQETTLRRDAPRAWARDARTALAALSHVGGGTMPTALLGLATKLAQDLGVRPEFPSPPSPSWLEDYLSGLERMGDQPREAITAYDRCLQSQPSSFHARYARAAAYGFAGNTTQAIADIDACVRLRPQNASLRKISAGLHFLRGSPEDIEVAERQLGMAQALGGVSPETVLNSRQVRLALGQIQPAYEDSAHYLALQDDDLERTARRLPLARAALRNQIEIGDGNRAGVLLAALDDRAQAMAFHGSCLFELQRFEEALTAFEEAARIDPDDVRIAFARIVARRRLGQDTTALLRDLINRPRFTAFLAEYPKAIKTYRLLARDQRTARDYDAALKTIRRGLAALDAAAPPETAPGGERARAELHYDAARIGMIRGLHTAEHFAFVRAELIHARTAAPTLVDGWYAQDGVFDAARAELRYPGDNDRAQRNAERPETP